MADRDWCRTAWWAHALVAVLVAPTLTPVSAAGGRFPPPPLALPADAVYDSTVGADRAVVFRHDRHVSLTGNRCTACHPGRFRILAPTRGISHRAMDAGALCGSCHDGAQAFGVRDRESCEVCHVGRPVTAPAGVPRGPGVLPDRPKGPRPIAYPRGDGSPGTVTFRHATHLAGTTGCAACHPRPFAMKSTGARPAGGMHDAGACGHCHDGGKAFAATDADACARCHVAAGGAP